MDALETLKDIVKIFKEIEKNIKVLTADKTLEEPILIDLVKTQKNMGYVKILEITKAFISQMK